MKRYVMMAAVLVLNGLVGGALAQADMPVMMSPEWAEQVCTAWNQNNILTSDLAGKWMENNQGRGYKIVHMYRSDCAGSSQVEMRLMPKDNKAWCTYGGKVQNATLDSSADYLMYAATDRWHEMGNGDYGPMKAMMFGRLQFEGPKIEAMSVMGPFEQFLLLVGKVSSDEKRCPK